MQNETLNTLAAKGCKIEEALAETYMGVETLLLKILRKVPATTLPERMGAALEAGDAKALFEASHELKGMYATTALTPAYEKCCEIVEIARRGSTEGVAPLLAEMKALHAELCAIIG